MSCCFIRDIFWKLFQFSQEEIPEPPAAGKTLFRDAVIAAIIAMIGGAAWTVYSTKKESYDDATLNQVNTVRAHITHAMNATNSDARIYHLQQAEFHCRKALDEAGGGYLAKSNQSQSMDVTQIGCVTSVFFKTFFVFFEINILNDVVM